MQKISIGLINFLNCLPINYTLEKWSPERLVFSWGHPALINQLLNDGQIVAGPVSAYEYLTNKENYTLIKEACITSDNACGSVILFSNFKIEDLQGKKIGLPYNSATSINMLKILLKNKGVSLNKTSFSVHKYELSLTDSLKSSYEAVLYIGDKALCERYKEHTEIYQYDLGELWKDMTGLPPVFGTWAARKDWADSNKEDYDWLKFIIKTASEAGKGVFFEEVIKKASVDLDLPELFVKDYLTDKIKYEFTPLQEKSLKVFEEKLNEIQ